MSLDLGRLGRLFVVFACAAAAWAEDAHAASLSVAPLRVDLPIKGAGTLDVTNPSDEEVIVQVRAYDWNDLPDVDSLEPSSEILAVPAVAKIPPGGKQVVRVARRKHNPTAEELSYRVVVSEVPNQAQAGGVRIAVSFNLPVFVTPPGAEPVPRLAVEQGEEGWRLVLANEGFAHFKLSKLEVEDATGAKLIESEELAYVLPGKSRSWPLPGVAKGALRATIATAEGEIELSAEAR